MKYLSINTVLQSFDGCRNKTQNKFWGMVSIIKAIGEKIIPAKKYSFSVEKVQTYLEELFRLEDIKKTYSTSNMWSVVFSTYWIDFVPEQMFSSKPNIYDVAAWFYRRTALDDDTTPEQIVGSFMDLLNISIEDSKKWFSFQAVSYSFETQLYSESNLMNSILKKLSLSDSSNKTLSFEGQTFIKSNPGSLGQAPFVQTLYANQGLQKCLILTQFDFQDFYPVTNKTVSTINTMDNTQLQQIFYGAPGTGKSCKVKEQTKELSESGVDVDLPNVFRTTFHPDTDYASFVGCYKPAMESKEPIYTKAQLIDKLSIIKNSGASYPCQKFGAKYWESLKELLANDIKDILSACGFTDSMGVEVQKGVAIGEDFDSQNSNKQIVYRFVPQVFTDAYVYAYTTKEPTYLVIEEINRGNCAQIFGDLFQLLDRKGGVSEYKIKADKDLAQYLRDQLGFDSEGIQDGKLCLPKNLHILATMNTSDQSLFPMDSAFKRRWEWEYVPINYDKSIKSGEFEITIGDKSYSWVGFIEKVNDKIFDLTQSEDKQMGNFFIKHSIDEKGFKSKVMFYLWYEVLRDETENNKYFFYKKTTVECKEELSKFTFKDLFGDKATETLQQFMEYLEVAPNENTH